MAWLNDIFAGGMNLARINPFGLALMALALVSAALAGSIHKKHPELPANAIKIISLIFCAGGALLAILG